MKTKLLALKGAVVSVATLVSANIAAFAGNEGSKATTAATEVLDELTKISNPIVDLINRLLTPALAIVGALGTLYCVLLGVKYARAEEPQEHEKAKKALKNAIIGFVLIFVLMLALKLGMPILTRWVAGF